MKSTHLSAALILAWSWTVGTPSPLAASDIVVSDSEKTKTYDCRGGSATVEGGFNVLTFRNCAEIIIDGGDNTIDAGVVGAIKVAGADNRITWTESADGRRPRITNGGLGNVISSRPAAAGAARRSAPSTPAPATAATDRVTISGDGVKVQGEGGTVTVGTAGGGTITIKDDSAGGRATTVRAGRLRIDDDGGKASHDCRGESATVNGDRNDLSFRNCDQVTVNGDANTVAVRAVRTLIVNGGDNKVSWEPAPDGSRPRITDNGSGNTVTGKR